MFTFPRKVTIIQCTGHVTSLIYPFTFQVTKFLMKAFLRNSGSVPGGSRKDRVFFKSMPNSIIAIYQLLLKVTSLL